MKARNGLLNLTEVEAEEEDIEVEVDQEVVLEAAALVVEDLEGVDLEERADPTVILIVENNLCLFAVLPSALAEGPDYLTEQALAHV